ncbi:MAG TPA: hypothetical protein PLA50_18100, partial [Bacteroidia bacterium]|nr:hypothetical protein [Bacteroidia bacterium]
MRGTFIAAVAALLLPLGEIAGAPSAVAAGEEGLEALDRFSETVRLDGEERILGMVGFFGQPQPVQWLILTGLPDLKGTFRESVVARGKVLAERRFSALPGQDLPSRALDREAVKVTSAAAFQRAEVLAEKRRIAFDSAHFQLRVR